MTKRSTIQALKLLTIIPVVLIFSGCNTSYPPVAEQIPSEKVIHGVTVSDPYKWMENPKDPKTIAYIKAENAYTDHYFKHISRLKENLQKELEERVAYQTRLG